MTRLGSRLFLGILTLSAYASPVAAADSTVFDLAMGFDVRRVGSPNAFRTNWRMQVNLSGKNSVDMTSRRSVGGLSQNFRTATALGSSGSASAARWRVVDAKTLQATIDQPNSTRTILVRVTGEKSCAIDVDDRLKPGASGFVFRGPGNSGNLVFEKPRLAYAECTVR